VSADPVTRLLPILLHPFSGRVVVEEIVDLEATVNAMPQSGCDELVNVLAETSARNDRAHDPQRPLIQDTVRQIPRAVAEPGHMQPETPISERTDLRVLSEAVVDPEPRQTPQPLSSMRGTRWDKARRHLWCHDLFTPLISSCQHSFSAVGLPQLAQSRG
jgi:hypothetical protein